MTFKGDNRNEDVPRSAFCIDLKTTFAPNIAAAKLISVAAAISAELSAEIAHHTFKLRCEIEECEEICAISQ
jgi:hypothetical protein